MFTHVLTADQIQRIHEASLRILQRTGVLVPHEDMLGRFAAAGAKVDRDSQRVRIPPEVVELALNSAGKQFTLHGRDLSKTAAFGQGQRNYNSIAGEASWVDEPGGKRRFATMADVATAARFGDSLACINVVGAMADAHDMPPGLRCVGNCASLIRNTTKPITFWYHDRASAKYVNELMIALRGDAARAQQYPICYPFLEPISALRFPHHGIDLLYETAKLNLPVPIGPMAQMGLSAPATVAATMAQENAEILAGVVVTQLIREGMPVMYGGICHAFDMRTTQLIFSGPEQAIFGVAMTQMGKHYGLPVYVNVGLTDSKLPDAQAGLEAAATLLPAIAAGADIFGHMGISGVDQATSLDILVLQHEVIRYAESANRTIEISDDTLGLDVIDEVGPGGSFIDTEHTVENFRRELWMPELLDRRFYEPWLTAGATDMAVRCSQMKQHILATHKVPPLDPAVDREFDRILAAAGRELK